MTGLATELADAFAGRYDSLAGGEGYDKSPASMARRSLRNACLSYLLQTPRGVELADAQLAASDNMTDTLAALQGLAWVQAPSAQAALEGFEDRWRGDALVMDKWFTIQALVPGGDTVERVRQLLDHPAFSLTNPNKVRSLLGVFSMMNPTGFHARGGAGYRLHADQIIALNALNPQGAARMAGAFNQWTRHEPNRRALMQEQLRRIAAVDGLSSDVAEIVSNALGMASRGMAA
jgi:aminopeptidase N